MAGEESNNKAGIIKVLKDIRKNTKKTDYGMIEKSSKRDYLGSFSLCGSEIPKDLEAEYDEEYTMTVRVRISEVADDWGEKGEKRITLQIKKIPGVEEIE